MRQRTFSRWIPVVQGVAPHQFRLSDELLAAAGPLWSQPDDLRRFVAQVVTGCPDPAEALFAAPVTGVGELLTVAGDDDWGRSLQEAKLWTIRIPTVLVEQAKWARLLERYDCREAALALGRNMRRTPEPPAELVAELRSCSTRTPSTDTWSRLEQVVRLLVAGNWLSAAEVNAALRAADQSR
ncbi:MAG: hypothetical protein K0R39_917 [Symbiobacteriaceae bacterium]|jgi:hypothetical protein|nr:hypothetical protein [Symbiobacteriaceae bacterium]